MAEKVELQVGKRKESFDIEHAERLLKMEKNGGWTIPRKSEYKYTEKDGLKRRSDKKTV